MFWFVLLELWTTVGGPIGDAPIVGRLNRTNGLVFMAQIPSVSFYQEKGGFGGFKL